MTMFKSSKFGGYVWTVLLVAAVAVQAERLEPVLRAHEVTGDVTVRRAGADRFEDIQEGRTYPYGSRFRAAAESSVRLAMSEESSVRVLANTEILFAEGSRDASVKTVHLSRGEVEARLGPNFMEGGNVLYVEAANIVSQARGSRYRVAARYDDDLHIVIVRVLEGVIRVLGENFEISELGEEQWVSILSPPDESFLRLKNMRGEYEITVIDEDHSPRIIATEEGSVVKIWQRLVVETGERVVTAVFSDPDGREIETIGVIYDAGVFAPFLEDLRDEDDEFPWDRLADDPERERPAPPERDNPMPPDDFMDELVERSLESLMPGFGRTPPPPDPPRPPVRPTPTPRGRQ